MAVVIPVCARVQFDKNENACSRVGSAKKEREGAECHLDFCIQLVFQQQASLVANHQVIDKFFYFLRQRKICRRTGKTIGNQFEENILFVGSLIVAFGMNFCT